MQDQPSILFLQETKCSSEDLGKLFTRVWKGILNMAIDAKGALGGISIIWNPMQISLIHFASSAPSVCFHQFKPSMTSADIRDFMTNIL